MQRRLYIEGMNSDHCTAHLQRSLTDDLAGVEIMEVNLDEKYIRIKMDMNIDEDELRGVIEERGFQLNSIK